LIQKIISLSRIPERKSGTISCYKNIDDGLAPETWSRKQNLGQRVNELVKGRGGSINKLSGPLMNFSATKQTRGILKERKKNRVHRQSAV